MVCARDAAQAVEQRVKRFCVEAGARQGAFNPYQPTWKTLCMHHRDGFVIKGARGHEADDRHVPLLWAHLKMTPSSKNLSSPGRRASSLQIWTCL
eukprot:1898395-Amphidinium_carterae.2